MTAQIPFDIDTPTEIVEDKNEVTVVQDDKMEFRLINPQEDGFLQKIVWNKEALETAVKQKIASYENIVYTEDSMKQAKSDRAELNKLKGTIEDCRKKVKNIVMNPYTAFEKEIKDVLKLIDEPIGIIDEQIANYESQQKEIKKKAIKTTYDENIGDLANVLAFEKIFDSRYLNKTYKLETAKLEVKRKIDKVKTDLRTIDGLESKHRLSAKDVYIKTLDLSRAMAEITRLTDLEERLAAEQRRKEEAAMEAKAAAERAREAEKIAENERIAYINKSPASIQRPAESTRNTVISEANSPARVENTPNQQEPVKQEQPKATEKKFRMRFYAVGTKAQLGEVVKYMKQIGVEYGRIE